LFKIIALAAAAFFAVVPLYRETPFRFFRSLWNKMLGVVNYFNEERIQGNEVVEHWFRSLVARVLGLFLMDCILVLLPLGCVFAGTWLFLECLGNAAKHDTAAIGGLLALFGVIVWPRVVSVEEELLEEKGTQLERMCD